MLHAYRHHWRAFATDDSTITIFIGPRLDGAPLEIAVVADADGEAIIHAMPARARFLKALKR